MSLIYCLTDTLNYIIDYIRVKLLKISVVDYITCISAYVNE